MRLKVSPEGRHIFKQLQGFKCVEESIGGTALVCGFLKKKEVGASKELRRVSGEMRHLWPTKKFWSLKVRDDVTYFSLGAAT